jgi:hypothetical protein
MAATKLIDDKPHLLAGGLTALITGGLMAAITASTGKLAGSLLGIVVLTMMLVIGGATYGGLVDSGRLRGGFGSGILFWSAALPFARLGQEVLVGTQLSESLTAFLLYQALVGGAFGLGFLLLHHQISVWLMSPGSKGKEASAVGKFTPGPKSVR